MPYKSVQFVESHVEFQPEKCLVRLKQNAIQYLERKFQFTKF